MNKEILFDKLRNKEDINTYIKELYNDTILIEYLFKICENEKTAVKYQAEKAIRQISEEKPNILYSHFQRMVDLLNSDNNFIKWGFVLSIPNMLKIDKENKWNDIREKYLLSLNTKQIAEFGNIVSSIYKILETHPEEEKYIMPILLGIDSHAFIHHEEVSSECLNVAKGHIIDCFDRIYSTSNYQKEIIKFVRDNKDNSRNQVRSKAKAFLNKYDK